MKKIYIYNINQYTSKGKLKKNAKTEMGLTVMGSDKPDYDNEYIAKTIKKRKYSDFVSPYVFTHIEAKNEHGERVIIQETITIGSDNREIITTPQTLYKLLTK